MKPERILVPIDVAKCPLEVFELVGGFAKRPEVTVILLHVLVPEKEPADLPRGGESDSGARWCLERLAENHVPPIASTLVHVRTGDPAEQIVAEAKDEGVDLIILPTFVPSLWNRLAGLLKSAANPFVSRLAAHVIREAACGVFMVLAKTRLDCARAWSRPLEPRTGFQG